jgi:hypothetical protein
LPLSLAAIISKRLSGKAGVRHFSPKMHDFYFEHTANIREQLWKV